MRVCYKLGRPEGRAGSTGITEPDVFPPTRRRRSERGFFVDGQWPAIAGDIEAILGLLMIALFTVGVMFLPFVHLLELGASGHYRWTIAQLIAFCVGWLIAAAIQFSAFYYVSIAFAEAPRPRPVFAALRQRFQGALLRLGAGVWWVLNVLGMLVTAEWILTMLRDNLPLWNQKGLVFNVIVFVVFFSCSYAANTFLVLAVGSLIRRKRILLAVWRFRVVLDVACALFGVSVNYYMNLPVRPY